MRVSKVFSVILAAAVLLSAGCSDKDSSVPASGPDNAPAAVSETPVTRDEAKNIALDAAKVKESDLTFIDEYDGKEGGEDVFVVEFRTEDESIEYTYKYEIKRANGEIVRRSSQTRSIGDSLPSESLPEDASDVPEAPETSEESVSLPEDNASEPEPDPTSDPAPDSASEPDLAPVPEPEPAPADTEITLEAAKQIALKDAGLSEKDVSFTKAEKDADDGVAVFEIEFTANSAEYEYEINAADGKIISKDKETVSSAASKPSAAVDITLETAKQIALKDAGLSEKDVSFTKAEKDTDDGVAVFEIEFTANSAEYEYEINAADGKIISKEVEKFTAENSGVGLEEAKSIALKHAGCEEGRVKFKECHSGHHHGAGVYEIEFVCGGREYEYTIRASDGAVLKHEVD